MQVTMQQAQRAYDNQAEADYEEAEAECRLDGHKVDVAYTWCAGEVEVNFVTIAGLEFDAYSFSESTRDDLAAQIRRQEAQ